MTFKTDNGWIMHGESAQSTLIAGVLPARGVHFLLGPNDDDNSAIASIWPSPSALAPWRAGGDHDSDCGLRRAASMRVVQGVIKGLRFVFLDVEEPDVRLTKVATEPLRSLLSGDSQ
jgi:hypothetical protein